HERSAAGARIDGGIGLNEILDANVTEVDPAALAGTDDPVSDRLAEPKWAAQSEHPLADAHFVAVAKLGCGKAGAIDLENRNVGFGVADDLGRAHEPAIREVN